MVQKLYINLLTNLSLISKDEGREFLRIWIDELPASYIPEKFGNFEPLRSKFDVASLKTVLESWAYPFLVKRSRPRLSGSIFMGGGKVASHGWIHIVLDFDANFQKNFIAFAQRVARRFHADFGFLHLLTQNEFKGDEFTRGVFSVRNDSSMDTLRVTTHDLKRCIPNLYWATFFGPSYIKLFGEDKFSHFAPGVISEKLDRELQYIQLTQELTDLQENFSLVNDLREKTKAFLNSNAFFDSRASLSQPYRTPDFDAIG
jgi:hypothetical protein